MAVYDLGSDASDVAAATRGDSASMYAGRPARLPATSGASSVQVQRRLSAATNRSRNADGSLDGELGGFSLKGLVKGVGNAAKAIVRPAVNIAAKVGVPGAGFANTLVNRPKPTPIAPPPVVYAAPALPKPPAVRPKPTAIVAAKPVKVAGITARPGTKPVAATKKEASTLATMQKDLAELKSGTLTAKAAHDKAQDAKKTSLSLRDRANKLSASSRSLAAKAKTAADAGDKIGAAKFAEQARALEAVANNTAVAASTAGNYAERAGNAIAAGTDAALAAGATNSETAGGVVAWVQRNPIPSAGIAAATLFGATKLFGKKRRSA
jgi:hypothetical protein